jgi:hypothetical protein
MNMRTISRILALVAAGLALGAGVPACSVDGNGDDGGGSEGLSCEHGMASECACPDGSMGTQMCAHDSSGFEQCVCGSNDESTGAPPTSSTSGEPGSSDTGDTSSGSSSNDSTGSTGSDTAATAEETGPVGAPPTAQINHPGDAEERGVDVPIPFLGEATDLEDGALSGSSMVWTDSIEGEIGQGEQFDAALLTLGDHVITLTATDADGNIGEATISLVIVEP